MPFNSIQNDIIEHINGLISEGHFTDISSIINYLEQSSGPACSIPLDYNLIYNCQIAEFIKAHHDAIDEFLAEYHDATGQLFAAEFLSHIAWTAVEWFANGLASMADTIWAERLERYLAGQESA